MALTLCGYKISRDGVIASSFLVSLLLIVIIIYYASSSHPNAQSGCEINPLQSEAPLLLIAGTSNFSYPNYGEKVIKSESKNAIDFACPGGSVVVNGNKLGSVVTATCVSNQEFEIQNRTYRWSQITCSGQVQASTKKSGRSCGGGEEILIGFDLGDGKFVTIISVCFDTKEETPLYSQFEITSSIQAGALTGNANRPYFYQDKEFYTVNNVDNLYKRTAQKKTINTLLGLPATSTQYIKDNSDKRYFLSRGHLAARADFFYVAQQNATFRFVNAAPQWQALNGYNWEKAERSARSYADKNKVDLQVWTGVFGTCTLPDKDNNQVDLYLYTNNAMLIPVPAFFWKVVYNPKNERGIALVSFNNPYKNGTEIIEEIFCDDVADKVNWLMWDRASLEDGYSFACTLTEFQKAVNVAPKLRDSGLLL